MSKLFLFEFTERIYQKFGHRVLKNFGQKLFTYGNKISNNEIPKSALLFDTTKTSAGKSQPQTKQTPNTFIASNNTIAGNVNIDLNVVINYSNLIQTQTDNTKIDIKKNVVIQDLSIIKSKDKDVLINKGTVIGSNCNIQDSQIGENCTIGYGSTIQKNCKIGNNCVLGAGSFLLQNTTIPDNQVWFGNPAQYQREIDQEDMDALQETQMNYQKMCNILNEEGNKNLEAQIDEQNLMRNRFIDEDFFNVQTDDLIYKMKTNNMDEQMYFLQQMDNVKSYTDMQDHKDLMTNNHHIFIQPDQQYVSEHLSVHKDNFKAEKRIEQNKDLLDVPNTDFFDKDISDDTQQRWKRRY